MTDNLKRFMSEIEVTDLNVGDIVVRIDKSPGFNPSVCPKEVCVPINHIGLIGIQPIGNYNTNRIEYVYKKSLRNATATEKYLLEKIETTATEFNKNKTKDSFIACLKYEVSTDCTSQAEELLLSLLKHDGSGTILLLCDLIHMGGKVLINILKLIGNIDQNKFLYSFNRQFECILENNSDIEVIDLIIRVIEKQNSIHNINLLRSKKFNVEWLDEYRLSVIKDFEDGYHI